MPTLLLLWGGIAAILSFGLSLFLGKWARKRNLAMAPPRKRDLHQKPIPRLGGLAIVKAFLAVLIILIIIFKDTGPVAFGFPYKVLGVSVDKRLLGIILATILLSAVMLRDDLKGVRPFWKLLTQIGAALILIAAGVGITYLNNPFGLTINLDTIKIPVQIGGSVYHLVLWADLLLVLWVVLLTNATNFIDGLDGLAASISMVAGVILILLSLKVGQTATALLSGILTGAIIGFLPFNLPPAKMFLGDTGSMFLGLMLAVLTVISGGKFATVLLVFGLVIIDAIYVVVKRIIAGKNPFTTPDKSHLHHRFLAAGLSPVATLIIIVLVSLAFGLAGLLLYGKIKIIMIGVLAIGSLAMFIALDKSKVRIKS